MGQSLHKLTMWFHLHYSTNDAASPRSKKRDSKPKRPSRDSSETDVESSLDYRHSLGIADEKMAHASNTTLVRTGVPISREYDKMVAGSPFRVLLCPELQAKKIQARQFCAKYNTDDLVLKDTSMPLDKLFLALRKERERLLRTVIGTVGDCPVIEPPFNFQYGCNIVLGDKVYANVNLRISDSGPVAIGNRVLIGPNVTIITERHDKDVQSRRNGIVYTKPVSIGDDCWIGIGTTILPGVSIGNGSVVGAGSVVTRDIPSFSVAWGVPARVIHGITDPDVVYTGIITDGY